MKEKVILLLSVLIGIAAFLLTGRYLSNETRKLMAGVEREVVVVAKKDLPSGTILKKEDLAIREEIKTAFNANCIKPNDVDWIIGRRLLYLTKGGQPIQWSYVEAAERPRGGLSSTLRPNMRAISIAVSGADTVSGLVQPSDHVDILGTFSLPSTTVAGEMETVTLTVLQNVTVLACGSQMAGPDNRTRQGETFRGGYNTVTLEVFPREAELLTFVQHMRGLGQLTLSLRNKDDITHEKDLPIINFVQLEKAREKLNLERETRISQKPR